MFFIRVLLAKAAEPGTASALTLERNDEAEASEKEGKEGKPARAASDKKRAAEGETPKVDPKREQARLHVTPGPASQAALGHLRLHIFDECFAFAVKHFLERKTCSLRPSFFLALVQRFPALAWRMITPFAAHVDASVNHFRWQGAYTVLLALIKQKSFNEDHPDVVATYAASAMQVVTSAITQARRDKAKPKLTKPLGQTLHLLTKVIAAVVPAAAAKMGLQGTLEQVKAQVAEDPSPVLRRAAEQALQVLATDGGQPSAKKAKRNSGAQSDTRAPASENGPTEEEASEKKKNKNKIKKAKKEAKKEAKKAREGDQAKAKAKKVSPK
jgi:hypothetical protein